MTQSQQSYRFQPLGITSTDVEEWEQTTPREFLYLDLPLSENVDRNARFQPTVLTRYLNYRDAESTKIVDDPVSESKSTKDFVLFVESLDDSLSGQDALARAGNDLVQAYKDVYGAGVAKSYVRIVAMTENGAAMSLDW